MLAEYIYEPNPTNSLVNIEKVFNTFFEQHKNMGWIMHRGIPLWAMIPFFRQNPIIAIWIGEDHMRIYEWSWNLYDTASDNVRERSIRNVRYLDNLMEIDDDLVVRYRGANFHSLEILPDVIKLTKKALGAKLKKLRDSQSLLNLPTSSGPKLLMDYSPLQIDQEPEPEPIDNVRELAQKLEQLRYQSLLK